MDHKSKELQIGDLTSEKVVGLRPLLVSVFIMCNFQYAASLYDSI